MPLLGDSPGGLHAERSLNPSQLMHETMWPLGLLERLATTALETTRTNARSAWTTSELWAGLSAARYAMLKYTRDATSYGGLRVVGEIVQLGTFVSVR